MKIKLKFAIFALFAATLLCSCGGEKIQLPPLIELKTPEKPLDAKYFKYSLNKDGHVAISELDWEAVVKDDVFENILIPATIEGIPVDSVKINLISASGFSDDELNEDVRKKRLKKLKYPNLTNGAYFCQRIEFEEGIKEIELNSQSGYYASYDRYSVRSEKTEHYEEARYGAEDAGYGAVGKTKFDYTRDGVLHQAENLDLKTFGLREIVFHKGQKKITGNFETSSLERLVLPEDLENIEFIITERGGYDIYESKTWYVNCPVTEIVWPKSDFKITSAFFRGLEFTKMDPLVLPDSLKEIRGPRSTVFPDMKVQKIVLPKKLNFTVAEPAYDRDYSAINEIEIPANAVITNRETAYNLASHRNDYEIRWHEVSLPGGLKKITLGENSTSDPFMYPSSLEEMDIADSAKINFAWQSTHMPNRWSDPDIVFKGCKKLSLATQAKLKEMGYKGLF